MNQSSSEPNPIPSPIPHHTGDPLPVVGSPATAVPPETLKRALHAFKKRLKLTKLDQESKLGVNRPMTSGKKSDVMGIIPPNDFPRAVWAELARTKQLKDMGGGFYSLP